MPDPTPTTAPTIPDLDAILPTLPPNVTRADGADLLRRHAGFPVSPRSIERWPLATMNVNGKAVVATSALFALAVAKMRAAPILAGGAKVAA